jgi:aminoglycoside phosphotransferase (APT) family kinase protein
VRVAPLERPSSGLSGETLFAEVTVPGARAGRGRPTESLVVRLPPAGDGLFPSYDLSSEAAVQQRLAATAVPVAAPVTFEPDPGWLGAPFVLMPRVRGRTLEASFVRSHWLREAAPQDQARLHAGFLEALASVHTLDWRRAGIPPGRRAEPPGLEGELRWWAAYLDWASDGSPDPGLRDGMRWCEDNAPATEPPSSLLWGDVQLANVVFAEDLGTAAILDWEMFSIGPPEEDLGWFVALHELACELGSGDLPGFPGRDGTIASYERLLGRPLVDMGWFEAFALVRSGAILARVARLLSGAGAEGSWLTRGLPQVEQLGRVIERRRRRG